MTMTLAQAHKLASVAEHLSKNSHFNSEECRSLVAIHQNMVSRGGGKIDRMRMREILHIVFHITDDTMLDLVFHSFDRDNDGIVNDMEWVSGLSIMLRGNTDELIEWCYYVYDLNGDGGLAREELSHCLKGCIFAGYGVEGDELEECERDIVEIVMRSLDVDRDGQITQRDFELACLKNPLLLVSIGPCLPPSNCIAAFLALICEKYRNYTGPMGKASKKKKAAATITPTASQTEETTMMRSITALEL